MTTNNILELKGKRFFQESRSGGGGGVSMNSKKIVNVEHIDTLINQLCYIKDFWLCENQSFEGALLRVDIYQTAYDEINFE